MVNFERNVSGAIWWANLQLMQVAPSGGQYCNKGKRCHLVAKFATHASGATWWPKLEPIQVAPPSGARSTNCWPNLRAMQVAPPSGQNWN